MSTEHGEHEPQHGEHEPEHAGQLDAGVAAAAAAALPRARREEQPGREDGAGQDPGHGARAGWAGPGQCGGFPGGALCLPSCRQAQVHAPCHTSGERGHSKDEKYLKSLVFGKVYAKLYTVFVAKLQFCTFSGCYLTAFSVH